MSKSHEEELSLLFKLLLGEATRAYPDLRDEFIKDLSRLTLLVSHRGIRVYLVDLPALGKHLDKCLSNGAYNSSSLPLSAVVSKRVQIPKFLRGLYLRVFHENGCLKEHADIEAVFFLRQIFLFAKKTTLPCSDKAVRDEIADFITTDSELPIPETEWEASNVSANDFAKVFAGFSESPQIIGRCLGSSDERTVRLLLKYLDKVSRYLSSTLGTYSPEDWRFRHGPGAISQATGPLNKYCWFNWSDRLESVFPFARYGFYNYSSWMRASTKCVVESKDPASRLIAVPKTFTKPRLIAAEPSEHQFCQQNLWHFFCDRSKNSWISDFVRFRDQRLNQDLCISGSRDGSLCTMDLSNASDRVTCHVVGQFFRSNPPLLNALRATRTRFVSHSRTDVPQCEQLRKFSTMGSACTFPVQSMIFLGVALATTLFKRGLRVTPSNIASCAGNVAVFGDDIIIPSDCRELVQRLLEVLYFKVNQSKTFSTGMFRESCGVDAFRGVNVTPAYWHGPSTSTPDSIASSIAVSNNFYKRFLLSVARYIASTIPVAHLQVVSMESGVLGLTSFVVPKESSYFTRLNRALQRVEARVMTISSRSSLHVTEDDSSLLQFFTDDPDPSLVWRAGYGSRPKMRKHFRWVSTRDLAAQQDLYVERK